MNILCTGAGGAIGGHLVKRLLQEGHRVRAVDKKLMVEWYQCHDEASNYGQLDLSKEVNCAIACEGMDHVYNLAADMGGMGYLATHRVETLHSVDITSRMIKSAYEAGVERYFQASSACVYPDYKQQTNEVSLKEEDAWPADPEPCLSPDTEVMTRRGFKPIADIGFEDEVATLSPVGNLEFHQPTALQRFPYDGEMIRFRGRSYDQLVTPGHKVYAAVAPAPGRRRQWQRLTARDFVAKSAADKGRFERGASWDGKPVPEFVEIAGVAYEGPLEHTVGNRRKAGFSIPIDAYLALLGWYITEGHCGHYGATRVVSIRQCNASGIAEIGQVLSGCGLKASFVEHDGRFNIFSKPLWAHFSKFGTDAASKALPEWVLDAEPEKLRVILGAMISGDGHVGSNGHTTYYTSSPKLRDQVVEIALKLGLGCTIGRGETNEATGNTCVNISLSSHTTHKVHANNVSYEHYTGYVYDLTVPNHVFYIRRNGRHCWTGNCYGLEKLYGEELCKYYTIEKGMRTRVARYHNVYGTHSTWDGGREKVPAAVCRKVALAKLSGAHEINIWGDGNQTRSFMWIDDCVEGTLRIMDSHVQVPINLGSSEMVSINQLVSITEEIAGVKLERTYDLTAPQGVRGRSSDNTMIIEELGWEPSISLRDGMAKLYPWVEAQVKASL